MTQASIRGPYRLIMKTGKVRDRQRGEYKWALVLSCGHMVFRYLLRIQNQGMARCRECAR